VPGARDNPSIGLLTLELHLPYAHSLKEKRMVLLRVKERLRGKFNVAVAELEHQDLWQRSVIGVVSISSSEQNLRQVLEGALKESENILGSDLTNSHIEIL
jgi:uncharacterized protein YlxP (DUF503 family)